MEDLRPARQRERLSFLDGLRGFALLNMIAYHALYDVNYLFGHPMDWYQSLFGYLWQQGICWCFLLLSGYCFSLGRHPIRRGLTVMGAGVLVSVVTCTLIPQQGVRFGVMSFLGTSMLLTALAAPALRKISAKIGLPLCLLFFFLTRGVPQGYLGFGGWRLFSLPEGIYKIGWLYPIGFPAPDFVSGDYFPVFPWLFLYWAGFFAYGVSAGVR